MPEGALQAANWPRLILAHHCPGGTAARAGVSAAGIGVATGHVAHRIVGRVGVGDGAQPRDGMHLVGVGVAVAACRPATQAIQRIVAIRLGVRGQRGARGRGHAMIPARWGPGVARPHQPVERVVAERLVLGGRASALGGHHRRETEHVAHVVIRARLAPDRLARLGGAGGERTLDGVVGGRGAEDGGGHAGFGRRAADGHARDLPAVGVAHLAHQELHRVGTGRRTEVDGLQTAIEIVGRGQRLPVGIDQARDLSPSL